MPKRRKKPPAKAAAPLAVRGASMPADQIPPPPDERVLASNLTLHQLFQQQAGTMLDRADLSDEQKQSILVAMSCPCCGAGGFSFTAKLKK
jgi:hypothetical protein